MTAEAHRLLDEVLPSLPRYSCEENEDCIVNWFSFGCLEDCISIGVRWPSTLEDSLEVHGTLDHLTEPASLACADYRMIGCEPKPSCDHDGFTAACINGFCTVRPVAE
jgi:hypothetical protein